MENIYKAPEAALIDTPQGRLGTPFFVTSIRKLTLLFVFTLGLYVLYWGYKQWDSQRHSMGKKIYPVLRSIFLIFYTHSLCSRISERLTLQQQPAWGGHTTIATLFVLVALIGWGANAVDNSNQPLLTVVVMCGILLAQWAPLAAIQRQANLASLDPEGASNSGFSGSNLLFMILGGVLWLFMFLGAALVALKL